MSRWWRLTSGSAGRRDCVLSHLQNIQKVCRWWRACFRLKSSFVSLEHPKRPVRNKHFWRVKRKNPQEKHLSDWAGRVWKSVTSDSLSRTLLSETYNTWSGFWFNWTSHSIGHFSLTWLAWTGSFVWTGFPEHETGSMLFVAVSLTKASFSAFRQRLGDMAEKVCFKPVSNFAMMSISALFLQTKNFKTSRFFRVWWIWTRKTCFIRL